jgi:DNA primase large subunit
LPLIACAVTLFLSLQRQRKPNWLPAVIFSRFFFALKSFFIWLSKVLKEIDACKIRGLTRAQMAVRLKALCAKQLPLSRAADVRKDVISHFVLRLAFCRPADRAWLLTQECELLRYRLTDGGYVTISEFMRSSGTTYATCSADEFGSIAAELEQCLDPSYARSPDKIFKVPFEDALDLVSKRLVLLVGGTAFVHERDFVSIVVARFRGRLADAMAAAFKALPTLVASHSQLKQLLSALPRAGAPSDYQAHGISGRVTLLSLPAVGDRSFAPCMSAMRRALKAEHKLKHWGRLQYGLFLKGIGLSLDEALLLFRQEFTKVMSDKDFESGYTYNIRHMYGKVGKRTDYSPFSCMKIIMGQIPANDDVHGCPFRHNSPQQLRAALGADLARAAQIHAQVTGAQRAFNQQAAVNELVGLVNAKHYQIACKRHFELTHPEDESAPPRVDDLIIHHPNQYFETSEAYWKLLEDRATARIKQPGQQQQAPPQ